MEHLHGCTGCDRKIPVLASFCCPKCRAHTEHPADKAVGLSHTLSCNTANEERAKHTDADNELGTMRLSYDANTRFTEQVTTVRAEWNVHTRDAADFMQALREDQQRAEYWRARTSALLGRLNAEMDNRRSFESRCAGLEREVAQYQQWMEGADRQGAITELMVARLTMARKKLMEACIVLGMNEKAVSDEG
jgi:hypothetical protein